MRHSLMRVWHMTGLDVRWFVPDGDPSVFNITYVARVPRFKLPRALLWLLSMPC